MDTRLALCPCVKRHKDILNLYICVAWVASLFEWRSTAQHSPVLWTMVYVNLYTVHVCFVHLIMLWLSVWWFVNIIRVWCTCTRVETVTCTVFLMFQPVYSIIITLSLKCCCRHGQLCHPHVHHMHTCDTCDTCDTKHTCACIVGWDVIIVGIIMFVLIIIITMTECLFHVCSVMTFS